MSPSDHGHETSKSSPQQRLSHAESARTLPHLAGRGVLSTIDAGDGYPYGSLAEFVSADNGDAIFLLSDLAAHTVNFKADARASLFVSPETTSGDTAAERPLALERVTLVGDVVGVDSRDEFRAAYLERHPHAAAYVDFSDFSFWRLVVRRARYIGGFGRMSWVDAAAFREAGPDPIAQTSLGAIAHMNEDHADALCDYVRAFSDVDDVDDATMVSLDRFGFDVQARDASGREQIVRVSFEAPLERPSQVRGAMVDMVKRARKKIE